MVAHMNPRMEQDRIARVRALLEGSYLWDASPRNLQDPLTYRTLPHVLGAAFDALTYVKGVLAVELNAHQGNPVVSSESARVVPAGAPGGDRMRAPSEETRGGSGRGRRCGSVTSGRTKSPP